MSEELERIIKSWEELDMKELMKFVSESEPDITELLKKYPEAEVPEVDEFF
jgi:hypothetical protein